MNYITTITSITVHLDTQSPVFGEGAVTITLDDAGAGCYLTLRELVPVISEQTSIDPDAWVLLKKAGDTLLAQKFLGDTTK